MSKGTVCAYTLGCKVNQYDTTAMLELLEKDGYQIVAWGECADVYLINTCTVTNTADKKSRNIIRRAVKQNPDAVVCVCGCLAQSDAQDLMGQQGVSAVIGTGDRGDIARIVRECASGERVNAVKEIQPEYEDIGVKTSGELTRGYIKIQEGCNNFCSYCIIPYVRGRVRFREEQEILREAQALTHNGVKEIVLTGIHISSYGMDGGKRLLALLRQLNGIDGILRIRLGSMEPHIFTDEFTKSLSEIVKVCPHFHVSMQSGSESILRKMNRNYTPGQYEGFLRTIRTYYDNPAVTTDIITGFPGEGEAEFAETMAFTEKMRFSRIHVFPYSERKGTPAATMEGKVPVAERKERARRLIELGNVLEENYSKGFLGTKQAVLFEQEESGYAYGYTDRYLRVCAKGKTGEYANVLLRRLQNGMIEAERV